MVSLFKEQIFVFHAISELFPSEISSFNLMQNMPGCHCRELADLTNLQKQCSFAQYNAPKSTFMARDSVISKCGALCARVTEPPTL